MADKRIQEKPVIYKVITIGDSGAGKSALIMRYVLDVYHPTMKSTSGIHFLSKTVTCSGQDVTLQIWDTAGQERFCHVMPPSYSRNADAILICYDITREGALEIAQKRIDDFTKSDNAIIILVGCKSDIEEQRVISKKEARELGLHFFEVSAKNNTNVEKVFDYLLTELAGKTPNKVGNVQEEDSTVTLNNTEEPAPKSTCPC